LQGEKSKHKQLNADEMMRSFAPGDLDKTESPRFTEVSFYNNV
jgi:hypothetical protein